MPQVQCPNCGGYKVDSRSNYATTQVQVRQGRPIPHKLFILGSGPLLLVLAYVGASIINSLMVAPLQSLLEHGAQGMYLFRRELFWEHVQDAWLLGVGAFGLLGILVGDIAIPLLYRSKEPASQSFSGWQCYCNLCGYRWVDNVNAASFTPNSTQRNLMNMGVQRLAAEQEEERRRKADLDETAAYLAQRYYQQHRKQ